MVISFSKFKNGCGGATGGTVSGITLWSADYTREYIDSVVSGYTKTEDFATINGSAITEGGNLVIQGGSGGTEYYAGTNIDITNNVISVTGLATINGSAITSGDNLIIEGTSYSGGTGIGIENNIISVTGDYETVVELTQAEYDALTAYSENTTYIITDAPAINMSAYTPTSGFSTINGSAITTGDAIVIETGGNYSAGTNIDITNDVISVTGITVPTKTSDLVNDSGFITQSDIPTSNTAFTNDAGYVNSGEVETQITSKDYPTKNWVQGHVTLAISGKLDTNVFTAYTANTQTELDNKQDASAMTAYYTSAQTDTAISNAVSGKADSSAVTAQISDAKEEIEAEIPSKLSDLQNDLNFVNSGQVQTQITSALTGYATIQDIPTNVSELNNDAGYITSADIPTIPTNLSELTNDMDFVDSAYVDNSIQTAMEGVATTGDVETMLQDYATEQYVDNSIGEVVQGLAYIGVVNDVTTSGNTVTVKKTGLNEGQIVTSTTSFDVALPQDITNAIAAETARTESTYAKIGDIPSLDGYATTGWVESQGYLKEHQDITGKLDTSAFTAYTANTQTELNNKQDASAMTQYATTAFTEQTYLKEHQSLSAYSTTEQVQTLINTAKQEVENEIPDVSDFVTSAQVNTQIESKGYITGYTETDPVFMSSPASGITSNDITNWNAKLDSSALTPYYTSAQTDTAIANAVSGKMDTSAVTADIAAATAATTGWVENQGYITGYTESDPVFMASAASGITAQDITNWNRVTGITVPTKTSELTNDSGFVTSGNVETQITNRNLIGNNSGTSITVANVRVLTQTQYNNLATKDNNVLYIINGS